VAARLQIPKEAKRGEPIELRIVIQHPMETGYRTDEVGRPIRRNTIRTLSCRYNGAEVFRADLSPGIAANPYLQFYTIAEASGELVFDWVDDEGTEGSERQSIVVSG
jgi:sulfur-oxidizing protein SoxZ